MSKYKRFVLRIAVILILLAVATGWLFSSAQAAPKRSTPNSPYAAGTVICPTCNGRGIVCENGFDVTKILEVAPDGSTTRVIAKTFEYCPTCNGLGYSPIGGWRGGPLFVPVTDAFVGSDTIAAADRRDVDYLGDQDGCHTCGRVEAADPSHKKVNEVILPAGGWIPDHCIPNVVYNNIPGVPHGQYFRPHCQNCANRQGSRARGHKNLILSWGWNNTLDEIWAGDYQHCQHPGHVAM